MYVDNSMHNKIAFRYVSVNSETLHAYDSVLLHHMDMVKSAHQVRRENLSAEVAKFGGPEGFSNRFDLNPDYVRQLLNGKDVKGGRNIGHRSARNLEKKMDKQENWMDVDHSNSYPIKNDREIDMPDNDKSSKVIFEKQMEAINMVLESLIMAMVLNTPAAAQDFVKLLEDHAKNAIPKPFSTRHELIGSVLGIARRARHGMELLRSPIVPRVPGRKPTSKSEG